MNQSTPIVQFVIAGVAIKQDADGRFCLNDLHVASGGADKDKPGNWSALDQTKALVAESLIDGNPAISPMVAKAGRYGGTFVCKELVYAYATWISPQFFLKVIRTFDAVVTGNYSSPAAGLTALQVGGIIKAVSQKQHEDSERRLEERFRALQADLDTRVHEVIAAHQVMIRRGETSGIVWNRWGLETKGMRGYWTWFGNRLAALGCQMAGKGEAGGKAVRLFDPDKCDAVKAALIIECEAYISKRLKRGVQGNLFKLVPSSAAAASA